MFTDTHCHLNRLNLDAYQGNLQPIFDNMKQAQVSKAMAIMCDLAEFDDIYDIIQTYQSPQLQLGMSVGVHPSEDLATLTSADVDTLLRMADNQLVWAIGETGLDYYWSEDNKLAQQQSLVRHSAVSQQLKKPLVVHTRSAKADTLDILKAEKAEHGIIHCFTEDWATAKTALDMGFYVSFSGIVTFKNAQALRDVAKKVPKDRLLIETDSPYLAPMPYRGKPNEPSLVPYVAQCLAEILQVDCAKIASLTTQNFDNLLAQYC